MTTLIFTIAGSEEEQPSLESEGLAIDMVEQHRIEEATNGERRTSTEPARLPIGSFRLCYQREQEGQERRQPTTPV